MTYKKQKQLLTEEYEEKLRNLKENFLKHTRYSKGQLVLYRTLVFSSIDSAYDSAYTFSFGIINNVSIDDSDHINYRVSSVYVKNGRIYEGLQLCLVDENDILEVLDAEAIIFKYFRKA